MKYLHPYYLFESDVDVFYHVSLFSNRPSIEKRGLLPGGGPTPWPEDEYPKGTYLFDNIKDARKYGFGNGDPFDIWEVKIGRYKIQDDPITKGAFYTEDHIKPGDISVIESHIKDVTNPVVEGAMVNLIQVVRWASRKYTAAELKPQRFDWGGFEATGLCFTPVDGPDDPRMNAWKDILSKHHNKELVPNFYYLDMSDFPIKTEKALTEFAELTYKSIKAEKLMKDEYRIHLSLSDGYPKPLIEIRLLEGCKIKILDNEAH